jgi:ABC-type multidrug transport system ATPase subunit
MIAIKDLVIFDKEESKLIVHLPSLIIEEGDAFIFFGKSGSGKSVLLQSLANEYRHLAGNILIDKKLIEAYEHEAFFMKVQFLQHNSDLLGEVTVYNFLSFFTKRDKKNLKDEIISHDIQYPQYIEEELKKFSLWQYKDTLIKHLPNSKKQTIALLSKIVKNPAYLILDEPFSFFTKEEKIKILYTLVETTKQKKITLIIGTSDEYLLSFFGKKKYYHLFKIEK